MVLVSVANLIVTVFILLASGFWHVSTELMTILTFIFQFLVLQKIDFNFWKFEKSLINIFGLVFDSVNFSTTQLRFFDGFCIHYLKKKIVVLNSKSQIHFTSDYVS